MAEKMLYRVETSQVSLEVYAEYCKIKHKRTFWSFVFTQKFFSGEKIIYYRDLSAVQFCDCCGPFVGYLKFEYPGSPQTRTFLNLFTDSAMTFRPYQAMEMHKIYVFIDSVIKYYKFGSDVSDSMNFSEIMQNASEEHEKEQLAKREEERIKKESIPQAVTDEIKEKSKILLISTIAYMGLKVLELVFGLLIVVISMFFGIGFVLVIPWIIWAIASLIPAAAILPLLLSGMKEPTNMKKPLWVTSLVLSILSILYGFSIGYLIITLLTKKYVSMITDNEYEEVQVKDNIPNTNNVQNNVPNNVSNNVVQPKVMPTICPKCGFAHINGEQYCADCGARLTNDFPTASKAKIDEERAKREAEERAKREAEERAKREAEERAKREAEERAKREAEERAKREAEERIERVAEALKKDTLFVTRLKYALQFKTDDGMIRYLHNIQDETIQNILNEYPDHLIREKITQLLNDL